MSTGPGDAYAPLDRPGGWPAPNEDVVAAARSRMGAMEDEASAWVDMVRRGMCLAAAYQSGALGGLYDADDAVAAALLAGVAGVDACGPVARPHVLSNHAALALAAAAAAAARPATEAWIRRAHAVACAPQVTHPVQGDHGVHDHVLGHGDYKHHPNDVRTAQGDWLVSAPVERVASEMTALTKALEDDAFAALDPVAGAAYMLHAVTSVGPFAAGNGRVARALASVPLLQAAGVPLAVPSRCTGAYRDALAGARRGERSVLVDFMGERCAGIVDAAEQAHKESGKAAAVAALRRWDQRVRTAQRLQPLVAAAAEAALDRHRRRTDLGWMADLSGAFVVAPPAATGAMRFDDEPVAIGADAGASVVVGEVLLIDAHPVSGPDDVVLMRAVEAEHQMEVRPEDVAAPVPALFAERLDGLLDRAVTALAVRAAAEADSA